MGTQTLSQDLIFCLRRNSKSEARNSKWFDQPFDRLKVPSRVEGLTTLSHVEGQYPMIQIQMTKTVGH